MYDLQDTIVALSSPPGRSARGLLRMTGPGAFEITRRLMGPCDQAPHQTPLRKATPTALSADGMTIPALVTRFAGPASFTGQDVTEILLPGNPWLLDRVLHEALAKGARLAQPGEFTYRAFSTGRIDLTQAEGIAGTIAATNDAELAASAMLRSGALGKTAQDLVDEISGALALVEAGIDFTDQDDVVPIAPTALYTWLERTREKLANLLIGSRRWSRIDAAPSVVLVGLPSAGKSTLFNRLLGRHRSVISPTPGTTRDVIQEPLTLTTRAGQEVQVMLVDIAGLDEALNVIDRQSQAAARNAIVQADLVLLLVDATRVGVSGRADQDGETEPVRVPCSRPREHGFPVVPIGRHAHADESMAHRDSYPRLAPEDLAQGRPWLGLLTKSDLVKQPVESSGQTKEQAAQWLAVSAATGQGIDRLRQLLADRLSDRAVSLTGQALVLQPRHEACLTSALEWLDQAIARLAPDRTARQLARPELIAQGLRQSLDHLGELGGVMTPDDVLGKVFATFCIGK